MNASKFYTGILKTRAIIIVMMAVLASFLLLINNYASVAGAPEGDELFDLSLPPQDHPNTGNWDNYEMLVGDVNRDGRDDLIWNEKSQTANRIYVGLGKSDGTFDLSLLSQDHPLPGWIGYKTLTADVDGDGRDDLIWNQLTATYNRIFVAPAKGTPEAIFDLTKPNQEHPAAGNWSGYEIFVGDVNRDG
ncbi:MAG: VCBS repeat-containing protein, partial [Candidatus Promineifilaceae bacterium]